MFAHLPRPSVLRSTARFWHYAPLVPPWFAYMVGRIRLCAKEMPGMLLDVSAHLARQTDALYSEV